MTTQCLAIHRSGKPFIMVLYYISRELSVVMVLYVVAGELACYRVDFHRCSKLSVS